MTPADVENAARRQYNAQGDTFWSSDEIIQNIFFAQMQLAKEAECIESVFTTPTVIGQQTYSYPSLVMEIKRMTWNGQKLRKINFREDDLLTFANQATTQTGTPQYYFIWNNVIYIRPIPSSVQNLVVYTIDMPQPMTTSSTTLDVPLEFHHYLVDYVVAQMAIKDSQSDQAKYYIEKWQASVLQAKKFKQTRERKDAFSYVQDEEVIINTVLGML